MDAQTWDDEQLAKQSRDYLVEFVENDETAEAEERLLALDSESVTRERVHASCPGCNCMLAESPYDLGEIIIDTPMRWFD